MPDWKTVYLHCREIKEFEIVLGSYINLVRVSDIHQWFASSHWKHIYTIESRYAHPVPSPKSSSTRTLHRYYNREWTANNRKLGSFRNNITSTVLVNIYVHCTRSLRWCCRRRQRRRCVRQTNTRPCRSSPTPACIRPGWSPSYLAPEGSRGLLHLCLKRRETPQSNGNRFI